MRKQILPFIGTLALVSSQSEMLYTMDSPVTSRRRVLPSPPRKKEKDLAGFIQEFERHHTDFNQLKTFQVQGFAVRGTTMKNATKRIRKMLTDFGYFPDTDSEVIIEQYKKICEESE